MGDKISALPPAAAAATDQLIPVVNDPGGTPETQKLTAAQLLTLMITVVLNQLNSQSNTLFDDNGASIGGADGSGIAAFCQGNIQMQMPGGAASFAAGKATIDALGNLSISSGAIFLDATGSVLQAGGASLPSNGKVKLLDSTDTTTVEIIGGSGGSIAIGGTQILGPQQPAIADAAVLLTDIVAKFNTLLAELRTHGLIAT